MNYAVAKELKACAESRVQAAGMALKKFSRLPNSLTPDHVKTSQDYRQSKTEFNLAFSELRAFNGIFLKRFKAEIKADRRA